MASRTTGQYFRLLNVILAEQILTRSDFFNAAIFRPPLHVKNLFLRTHKSFWVAMATETPFHLQRRRLISDRHLIDAAVAGGTAHSFVHVNAVIEVRVVR